MHHKRGFTLLELLIAATIMSVLAILATSSYRKAVAETRIQDAKNRLQVVANAVQRYMMDYPNDTFIGMSTLEYVTSNANACDNGGNFNAAKLIRCGYLENRQWTDNNIAFVTCGAKNGDLCGTSTLDMPLACMAGRNASFGNRYNLANGYRYCLGKAANPDENLGS